jgi:dTDP-4-dehydrorhamnose reductase
VSRIRVLVTGTRGQLGTELVNTAPANVEVAAVTRAQLDIGNPESVATVVSTLKPAWIINAAAYTAVDKAETDTPSAFRVNRDGPRHLGEAAQRLGARMLHVSTDFVFDGRKSTPYLPGDPTGPLGTYGRSKLDGEYAVRSATENHAVIVRTGWVYAAHGQNFARTIVRLLRERPELRVVADQVGTPTHAASLARALWKLIEVNVTPGATLHFSDAGACSWYDFAMAIREFAQASLKRDLPPITPIRTQDYPTPARRPAYSVLDKTDIWALTGPGRHWREPLAPTVAALVQQ